MEPPRVVKHVHVGFVYLVVFGFFTFQLGKKIGYEGAATLACMVVIIPMTMMFHELDKEAKKRRLAYEAKLQQIEMGGEGRAAYDDEYEVIGREGELYMAVPLSFLAVMYVLIVLVLFFIWFDFKPISFSVTIIGVGISGYALGKCIPSRRVYYNL